MSNQSYKPLHLRIIIILAMVIIVGCRNNSQNNGTPTIIVEKVDLPTPASTLPELINNLSSNEPLARIVSAEALLNYNQDDVTAAIPSLINNLYHNKVDVQISAAALLGWLGPRATQAVPDLIAMLENNENNINSRVAAAKALGTIGDISVVPILARQLYQDPETSYMVEIFCAESIAILANQKFRDAGGSAYVYDGDVPRIVLDARSWWEQEGQYQNWVH